MTKTRAELKASAKESMRNCNKNPYLITIVYLIVLGIISGIASIVEPSSGMSATDALISFILSVLTTLITTGYTWWALSASRGMDNVAEFKLAFVKFVPVFILSFLVDLFTGIGLILIIIPGIIVSLGLAMSSMCYRDNIENGFWAAIKESWKIMKGHKADLFVLILSFIPWILLTVITFGIVGIYTAPYITITFAKFYDSIK